MSFGYSVGDGILLVQLAWNTLQCARKACGEHDELTREVASLHRVLRRLQKELANPDSLLNRADDDRKQELGEQCSGCKSILNLMNSIVTKYNKLSDKERSARRIWQKVRFGNGEMKDLAEIRMKLSAHTSAIIMSLNFCSLGSQGRVERRLNDMGGGLKGIRGKVDWIAANMTARSGDGTVWTSYENDDRSFWRQLRRELVKEGYRSSVLRRHKRLLTEYVKELGQRGVLDQVDTEEDEELDKDGHDVVGSDEGDSDVVELDDSEIEESLGSDSLVPTHSHNQLDKNSAQEVLLVPGNSGVDSVAKLLSLREPAAESPSPGDELGAKSVHLEEILDEDFLPGAHPNCFTGNEEIPAPREGTRQKVTLHFSSNTQTTSPVTMNAESEQPNQEREYPVRDFILASSNPNEINDALAVDEEVEQPNATNTPEKNMREGQDIGVPHGTQIPSITFVDTNGRSWMFPFSMVKTWAGVANLITKALPHVEPRELSTPNGSYDLVGPDGSIILPEIWFDLIQPSWRVALIPRDPPEDQSLRPSPHQGKTSRDFNHFPLAGVDRTLPQVFPSVNSGPLREGAGLPPRDLPLRSRAEVFDAHDGIDLLTSSESSLGSGDDYQGSRRIQRPRDVRRDEDTPPPRAIYATNDENSPLPRASTLRANDGRETPTRSKTSDYPRETKIPRLPRASTFQPNGGHETPTRSKTSDYPREVEIPRLPRAPTFTPKDWARSGNHTKTADYPMHDSIPPLPRASTFTTHSRRRDGEKAVSKKHQPKENRHRLDDSKKSRDKTSSRDKNEDDLPPPQMRRVETFAPSPNLRMQDEDSLPPDPPKRSDQYDKDLAAMKDAFPPPTMRRAETFAPEPEQREEKPRQQNLVEIPPLERWEEHKKRVASCLQAARKKEAANDYAFDPPIMRRAETFAPEPEQREEKPRQRNLAEIPLPERWDEHKERATRYMQAARKKTEAQPGRQEDPEIEYVKRWDDHKRFAAEYLQNTLKKSGDLAAIQEDGYA